MANETENRHDNPQDNRQDSPQDSSEAGRDRPEAEPREKTQTSSRDEAGAAHAEAGGRQRDEEGTEHEASGQEASERERPDEASLDAVQSEIDILRGELMTLQAQLEAAKRESADFKDKFLRARADLENYRRRAAQDSERAREAGVDSAVLAVLPAYDDLGRALLAAETDPSNIIPGVEAVREGLKRNLEALGIKEVGKQGDTFDPDFHEALTSVPADDKRLAGKVAEVFQVGFTKEGRLVRPARVVVYQD